MMKSVLRIAGCIIGMATLDHPADIVLLSAFLFIAEVMGIVEEIYEGK